MNKKVAATERTCAGGRQEKSGEMDVIRPDNAIVSILRVRFPFLSERLILPALG